MTGPVTGEGVAIIVPMWRRPHRVTPLLESVTANTSDPYRVVFVCTDDDHDVIRSCRATGADVLLAGPHRPGDYARKINLGVNTTAEDLIFLGADDLAFHRGWLEEATKLLTDGVGVVGTNDLCNRRVMRGEHSTHSLVTRTYAQLGTIDEPNKLLHEGYPHEYVDDELVATAKHRQAWAFARRSIVEHLHPMVGKAPTDNIYAAQARRMRQGRRIYDRRRRLWEHSTSPSP